VNVLSNLWAALKTVITEYPAIVGLALNAGVAALAYFGFHVTPEQLTAIVAVVMTFVTVYIHSTVKPTAKLRKEARQAAALEE
jgi:uncharacterized membrane protein YfcA